MGVEIENHIVPGIQNSAGDTVNSDSVDFNKHGAQSDVAVVGLNLVVAWQRALVL